jgi:hypothetical protein
MYSVPETNFSSTNFTLDWPGIELGILVENPEDNCLKSPLTVHYTSQHSKLVGGVADTPRSCLHRNIDPVSVSSKDMIGRRLGNADKRRVIALQ